jgi:predicted  nucleic acid-binding Zn-ribbon protein
MTITSYTPEIISIMKEEVIKTNIELHKLKKEKRELKKYISETENKLTKLKMEIKFNENLYRYPPFFV